MFSSLSDTANIVIYIILGTLFTIIALYVKSIRKTMGLLLVILGAISSFTVIGVVIGIPMIIIGGLLLFV